MKKKYRYCTEEEELSWKYNDSLTDAECCQRLWRKVIEQIMMDALSNAKGEVWRSRRNHARAWLQSFAPSFQEVCWLAGFDPTYVRDKCRRYFQQHPYLPSVYFTHTKGGQCSFDQWLNDLAHATHPPPRKRKARYVRRRYRPRFDKTRQYTLW
jgi:hypothetical protein